MSDGSGSQGYDGYGWTSGDTAAYPWQTGGHQISTSSADRWPWWGVATLGLLTFAASFGSPADPGIPVYASVVAAVVAAVGLLPEQNDRGWLTVVTASTGCVSALAIWTRMTEPDWTSTTIMVSNALQVLFALGATLFEARAMAAAKSAYARDYSAYVTLAQGDQLYDGYAVQYERDLDPYVAAGQATGGAQIEEMAPSDSMAAVRDAYARQATEASGDHSEVHGGPSPNAAAVYPGVPGAASTRGPAPLRHQSLPYGDATGGRANG